VDITIQPMLPWVIIFSLLVLSHAVDVKIRVDGSVDSPLAPSPLNVGFAPLPSDPQASLNHHHKVGVVLMGGLFHNSKHAFKEFIELTRRNYLNKFDNEVCAIGVIMGTMLHFSKVRTFTQFKDSLVEAGATDVTLISMEDDENNDQIIKKQHGFVIVGDDEMQLLQLLKDSSEIVSIKHHLLKNGGAIAGVAAAAAVLSGEPFIVGGMSHMAIDNRKIHLREIGSSPLLDDEGLIDVNTLQYTPRGLGFYHGFFVDTHFTNRGRQGRFAMFMDAMRKMDPKYASYLGYGIDRDTGLLFENINAFSSKPDGTTQVSLLTPARVVGNDGVGMMDLRWTVTCPADSPADSCQWHIGNIIYHLLTRDDSITDIIGGEISICPAKDGVSRKDYRSTEDPFVSDVFNVGDTMAIELESVNQLDGYMRINDDVLEFHDISISLYTDWAPYLRGLGFVSFLGPEKNRSYSDYVVQYVKDENDGAVAKQKCDEQFCYITMIKLLLSIVSHNPTVLAP
jgi:hypothetical protein